MKKTEGRVFSHPQEETYKTRSGVTPGGRTYSSIQVKNERTGAKSQLTTVKSKGGHRASKETIGKTSFSDISGYPHLKPGTVIRKKYQGRTMISSGDKAKVTKPLRKK